MVGDRLIALRMLSSETPLERLFRLLEDWRSHTHAETNLIHAADWRRLEELQAKKAHLQMLIEKAETAWLQSEQAADVLAKGKARLRQLGAELVALETKNRELLSEHLARTDDELKNSNRTISSLRNIQNAYGRSGQSFWQAYS